MNLRFSRLASYYVFRSALLAMLHYAKVNRLSSASSVRSFVPHSIASSLGATGIDRCESARWSRSSCSSSPPRSATTTSCAVHRPIVGTLMNPIGACSLLLIESHSHRATSVVGSADGASGVASFFVTGGTACVLHAWRCLFDDAADASSDTSSKGSTSTTDAANNALGGAGSSSSSSSSGGGGNAYGGGGGGATSSSAGRDSGSTNSVLASASTMLRAPLRAISSSGGGGGNGASSSSEALIETLANDVDGGDAGDERSLSRAAASLVSRWLDFEMRKEYLCVFK